MNYKTNRYSRAFTLLELLVAVSVISMMSSVILAAVQNARDKGRISGGIRFATNAYRAFGDKMTAYFDFNDTTSTYPDKSAGGKGFAVPSSVPNLPLLTPTRQSTSYSTYASSSVNFLRHTPTGTFQYLRTLGTGTNGASISNLPLPANGAVSLWLRVVADSNYDNLVLADNTSGKVTFMYIPNSGSANFPNQLVVSDKGVNLTSGFSIADGNWHNVTFSSPANGPEKLYVDGNLVDTEVIGSARTQRSFTYIGWNGNNPGTGSDLAFQGDMDDFMMFQQDLAESEVKQIYAMGAPSHPVAKANSSK